MQFAGELLTIVIALVGVMAIGEKVVSIVNWILTIRGRSRKA